MTILPATLRVVGYLFIFCHLVFAFFLSFLFCGVFFCHFLGHFVVIFCHLLSIFWFFFIFCHFLLSSIVHFLVVFS